MDMRRVLPIVCLLFGAACQDSAPPQWTVGEVHQEIGLEGGHQQLACAECHQEAVFKGVASACESCHLELYGRTTAPDHAAAGYSTVCAECHSSQAWSPSSFDHDLFGFPLEGAHAATSCVACHAGGVFEKLPGDCWSCHQEDYAGTADPDHAALGFERACEVCHTVAAWSPSLFDHDLFGFPLEGAHAATSCGGCHADGQYADTPSDCRACHQQDEPPDHFGPDCGSCHTSVAWEPSTFDHEPLFPLLRGSHRRYRDSCASCHPAPANYGQFTCTDCHDGEHRQSRMDREHAGIQRYRYESSACYECHPRGSGEDAEEEGDD